MHVRGRVISETADDNPDWNFHLEPDSITLFDQADDDCDAAGHYVSTQLDRIGEEGFLPDNAWAPSQEGDGPHASETIEWIASTRVTS